MNIEETLFTAFCDGITVSAVPAGFAVSTGFEDASGDRIGFYLTKDDDTDMYRIEDDGSLVPTLMASGVDLTKGTREKLFQQILEQGRVIFDDDSRELRTHWLREEDVPAAAMRFVATLMRVANLSIVRPEIVSANFQEDAVARIKQDLGADFRIKENESLSPALSDYEPDILLLAPGKTPVAVFIATSDQRIYEAILMQMAARHEAKVECSIVALIDKERSKLTTHKMRQRARNRLAAAPEFYGEEAASVLRIAEEARAIAIH